MSEPFIETLRRCPPSELPALRQSLLDQLAIATRYKEQGRAALAEIEPEVEALEALQEVQEMPGYSGPPANKERLQALKTRARTIANTASLHSFDAMTAEARLRILDEWEAPPPSPQRRAAVAGAHMFNAIFGLTVLAVLYIASPWIAGFFLAACLVVVVAGRHR